MFAIIGIVVVFGCIVAGYLMEHGNLKVLIQPAELIIIAGAALGTVLVANPLHVIKQIVGGLVVARAPGPQLASEGSQSLDQDALEERVHVLVARNRRKRAGGNLSAHRIQRCNDRRAFCVGQEACSLELARMRLR